MKTINLTGENLTLELTEDTIINVTDNNIIYLPNNISNIKITINMKDNSELIINDFNINNKEQSILVNQTNNTKFTYNHTFKTTGEYNLTYLAKLDGDNNQNDINIYGVSLSTNKISLDGVVKEHTKDNILNENVKILNLGGGAYVSPMLHVSTLDVIANHNTAISNIRSDELFYLESKGISKEKCIELISDGYTYGLFKNDQKFMKLIKK